MITRPDHTAPHPVVHATTERVAGAPALTIVVADDSTAIRKAVSLILRADGHALLEARTGREALEAIHSAHPDLVLLDAVLPDIHGLEVCRIVRTTSRHPDLRIVMMTALATPAWARRALTAGVDFVLPKPFDMRSLRACIRNQRLNTLPNQARPGMRPPPPCPASPRPLPAAAKWGPDES